MQGNLYISFRALTYEPLSKRIQDLKSDTIINVQLISGAVQRLEEVFVHPKRPHRRGRDTIELDVKSFLQGDERTVEDLLRKIPGINVGTDGSIKIGNKEVEKVMVEGDDFFEKGYRLLTQSMSVQPLEKVQVLQRYSNNKHLKGIENSDKVALNLQLKTDSKNQWMGSVSAQGAPVGPKYYQVGANLMNFGKKNKYYLLGTANNNGVDAVSSINHLLNSGSADEPGQVGVDVNTPVLIDNTPELPGFDYRRTNFNKDRLLSFNTIFNPTERLKIKWLGFLNAAKKTFYRNTVQEYQIEDIHFTNYENYEFSRKIDNYFSKLELQFEKNKRTSLTYAGNFGSLKQGSTGNLLLNEIGSTEISKTSGYMTNHNLTHSYKLSEQEALVSSVRFIAQRSPLDYNIDHYYYEDLFGSGNITDVTQHIQNDLQYLGATSHYVRRMRNGNFFEAAFVSEYRKQVLNTDLLLHCADGTDVRPAGFSNDIDFTVYNTDLLTKYTIKGKKVEWTPRLQAGVIHNTLSIYGNPKNKSNVLFSPGLSTKWVISRKGKLEADLSFQQKNTSLTELIPNYYSTGIRNFIKGQGDLAILNSGGALLTYTHGSMIDRFFASLSTGYTRMFDYMGSENSLNPNFNLLSQVLLKDKKSTFCKAELNYYVKLLNGNIRLDLGTDQVEYETGIEGIGRRKISTNSYNYGLEFRSVWKSKVNLHTGYSIQASIYRAENTNKLKNRQGFLNVFISLGKDWQCSMKNESYQFGSFLNQPSKVYYFSDFSLSFNVKKIKTKFDMTTKNLLNTKNFQRSVLTETYRSVTEYRLLPRYISFGADWNF